MAITFNPSVSFKANSPQPAQKSAETQVSASNTPVRDTISDVAKFYVVTAEMAKASFKGILFGFLSGTAVAGFQWAKKTLPNAFKGGESLLEAMEHPAKKIGWKGNTLAGATALAVLSYQLVVGKLKANLRTANVDHQLYTGHRDV